MQKISILLKIFIVTNFNWLFGYCHQHGWFTYPKKFKMNTAYIDEKSNYSYGCKYCKEECDTYYDELWRDYYAGRF